MLEVAISIARKNVIKRLPRMGAVLKVGNKVYYGYNQLKTHPLQAKYGRTDHHIHLHAEIDAIRWALKEHKADDLKGSALYVARVLKDGTVAMAKPCVGCQQAIAAFEIETVEWTE